MSDKQEKKENVSKDEGQGVAFYKVRFRQDGQEATVSSKITDFIRDDVVMVKTDHGLEPAIIMCNAPTCAHSECERRASFELSRRPNREERERYTNLAPHEARAFSICSELIVKHSLSMSLVRVEKFFNGSKMIFYFTAENRVDFRELVKDLVQEFRTRVEMRQIGVRHETKMLGGIGTCGRELCCSSFMKKFDSVSIKMAKEQDLPLNPSKISGVCNRLLCCLTYEYDTYRKQRRKMPKVGTGIIVEGQEFRIKRQSPLQSELVVGNRKGEEKTLPLEVWQSCELVKQEKRTKKKKNK